MTGYRGYRYAWFRVGIAGPGLWWTTNADARLPADIFVPLLRVWRLRVFYLPACRPTGA